MNERLHQLKLNNIRKSKGQVAVVILLVITLALVIYAVTMNLGRVSQSKTIVTVASNSAASLLASQMASYGQKLFKETMGGRFKICSTNWLGILGMIIGIILVIITAPAGGAGGWAYFLAIAGLALSTVSLVLNLTVIQPGLTSMWNKMIQDMDTKDSFLEQALQTALFKAVDDPVQVPDIFDLDNDTMFGKSHGVYNDHVSRLGIYYDKRLKDGLRLRDIRFMQDFLFGLRNLVYGAENPAARTFALTDPGEGIGECAYHHINNPNIPSVCNPCCQPHQAPNMYYNPSDPSCNPASVVFDPMNLACLPYVRMTPEGCDCFHNGTCASMDEQVGTAMSCWNPDVSPFMTGWYPPPLPFVYDRHYQNRQNTFRSFLENFGQDDGHQYYHKERLPETALNQEYASGRKFYSERTGVFRLLHDLKDGGMNLNQLNPAAYWDTTGEHCYWYDQKWGWTCLGRDRGTYKKEVYLQPMLLPYKPKVGNRASELRYQTNPFVDGTRFNLAGKPPLAPDAILNFDDIEAGMPFKLFADESACAHQSPANGYWKRGADEFCSERAEYPYNVGDCGKFNIDWRTKCWDGGVSVDCECNEIPVHRRNLWRDDAIDDIGMQIRQFVDIAKELLDEPNIRGLVNDFEHWYEDLAVWIETRNAPGKFISARNCFKCRAEPNQRVNILQDIGNRMHDLAVGLIAYAQKPFHGNAWCQGTIAEIITCLQKNVEGVDPATGLARPVGSNKGNDYRYEQCGKTCSATCANLPQSLVPGFNPAGYVHRGNDATIQRYLNCLDNKSAVGCPVPDDACDAGSIRRPWRAGNSCYDALADILAAINPSCDLRAGNPWIKNANGSFSPNTSVLGLSEDGGTGWLFKARHSALEAKNQVAKFRQRFYFLSRVNMFLWESISTLIQGRDQIKAFLTGPAATLIAKRRELRDFGGSDLSRHIIYGWQSEPTEGRKNLPDGHHLKDEGYWHIVKVEAGLPQRCIGSCATDENPDELWPRVRTYTRNLGLTRCYEMQHLTGVVKVRVIRWDEDQDRSILSFPNKVPIWISRNHHPDRSDVPDVKNKPHHIMSKCPPLVDHENKGPDGIYRGAFMTDMKDSNRECWLFANEVLANGVMTETCARYYAGNDVGGFTFEFIQCPGGW
jgi:hypothetical protein